MSRYTEAKNSIAAVHATLQADVDMAERTRAIDAAYRFGQRAYWPYKMWLKARREYMIRWSDQPAGPMFELPPSPLERMRAGNEGL